jgi:hypothetical protein
MSKKIPVLFLIILFPTFLCAQIVKTVVVEAGTKVTDYFSASEHYRYPGFIPGEVFFKNGKSNKLLLNYDIIFGEIVFIQGKDTLSITKKKEIKYIAAIDTFYFDKGFYIELVRGGNILTGVRNYVKLNNVLKEGAFGTTARNASVDTYSNIAKDNRAFDLVPAEDLELRMIRDYWISGPVVDFTEYNRKNVLKMFPGKEDQIKAYLKNSKVDFDSVEDVLRFTDFLKTL